MTHLVVGENNGDPFRGQSDLDMNLSMHVYMGIQHSARP